MFESKGSGLLVFEVGFFFWVLEDGEGFLLSVGYIFLREMLSKSSDDDDDSEEMEGVESDSTSIILSV